MTFPAEFRHIQHYYPICFRKDEETKEVQALALFGFEQGENLFIKDEKWDAQYIPMTIEIQPFLIGLDNKNTETGSIYIDMDSPRVDPTDGGTRVFNEDGSGDRLLGLCQAAPRGASSNERKYSGIL